MGNVNYVTLITQKKGDNMKLIERKEALEKQREDLRVMFMKVEGALELVNAIITDDNASNGAAADNVVKKATKKEKVK